MSERTITLNAATRRFELVEEGHTAYIEYERTGDVLDITHTIVPDAIGGRGIAGQLARHVLDYAAAQQLRVRPSCSYIRAYIDKHPQYQPLMVA